MSTPISAMQFQHRIGDDETLTIPIYDSTGTAVDCSTGTPTMTLSCRAYPGSSTETFDQSSSGATLTGTTTGVTFAMTEAFGTSLVPGQYIFNVSKTAAGTTVTYPLNSSFVLILLPQVQ